MRASGTTVGAVENLKAAAVRAGQMKWQCVLKGGADRKGGECFSVKVSASGLRVGRRRFPNLWRDSLALYLIQADDAIGNNVRLVHFLQPIFFADDAHLFADIRLQVHSRAG